MTRRFGVQAALLLLTLGVTLPPLARLCVGRTPSLLAPANAPFWERRPPRPLPLLARRCAPPAPPGTVTFADPNLHAFVYGTDENALLRPLEHPDADPHGDTGTAGRWLTVACCMGRTDPVLRDKQTRVASRILAAQFTDGVFGQRTGMGKSVAVKPRGQWETVRGLLCFYELTHTPAALYAALSSAQRMMGNGENALHDPRALLPLAQMAQETGDREWLPLCRRLAVRPDADATGLCALYELTGQREWLERAAQVWARRAHAGRVDTDGAAALWTDTGDARFLPALRLSSAPFACPLAPGSLACGRISRGLRVNVWTPSVATFGGVHLAQAVQQNGHASRTVTLTVHVPRPTAFLLNVPPCAPSALLNGKPIAFTGTLLRRWRNGDVLVVGAQ